MSNKCKTCLWGTKSGWCILEGENEMMCKANNYYNYEIEETQNHRRDKID